MQRLRPRVRIPEVTSRLDCAELSRMREPEFGATAIRFRSEHYRSYEGARKGGAETATREQGFQGQAGRSRRGSQTSPLIRWHDEVPKERRRPRAASEGGQRPGTRTG